MDIPDSNHLAPYFLEPSLRARDAAFALRAEFHEVAGFGSPLSHLGCDNGIAASWKVDNRHRVEGLMAAGAIRCVDVKRAPKAPPAVAMVNGPEDVKPRARALRCVTKLPAADILARLGPVEHAMGRAVGDQDIDVRRDQVPLLAKLCAAFQGEGHVKEPWLPGRAPKGHSPDLDAAVQEIVTIGKDLRSQTGVRLQASVVVSGDHHFVPVRQVAEELSERSRFDSLARAAEVARMDQHVTVWNAHLPVQAVGVAEENQSQGQVSSRWSVSSHIDGADARVNHTWAASRTLPPGT